MGLDPADTPAGHRPVLGEAVDEQDAVLARRDVEEGRRTAMAVVEQRIDLVGDDPKALFAGEIEDRLQRLVIGGPAGRVGRRVDEQRLGPGVIAAAILSTSQDQPLPDWSSVTATGTAPATPAAAAKFGQAGDRYTISSPCAGDRVERQLDGMHAGRGDDEFFLGETLGEMPA